MEAIKAPIKFETIENFNLEDPECLAAVKKNKYLLIGNLGSPGATHVENRALYKELKLYAKSKPKIQKIEFWLIF